MVSKDNYFYPDSDHTITSIFIDTNEPYRGYWQESEDYVLLTFRDLIKTKKLKNILDVGSGHGRIITQYKNCFKKITIIEPDKTFFYQIQQNLLDKKNTIFINKTFLNSQISKNSYDVVLCAYTLEHITPQNLKNFIKKLYDSLKPQGYLILLTSHSKNKQSHYVKTFIDYNKIRTKKISEKKFIDLRVNDELVISYKRFSINELKNIFKNFNIIETKIFHILNNHKILDKIIFRDKFYNALPIKKRYGHDVYMLLQKPQNNSIKK
jgi:ubiquinone/menaquinone biosynthesis C-methylase UbiE